jgi:redox-sensitive bicupin YhaK (pirin superfamily)
MMNPRYRDIANEQIPEVKHTSGAIIKVIAGEVSGVKGPVQDIVIDPEYIDVTVPENSEFKHSTKQRHTVFAYIIDGQGYFCGEKNSSTKEGKKTTHPDTQNNPLVDNGTIVLFQDGEEIVASTGEKKMRFLLISGKPIGEPVAWQGPIVMNTQEELQIAFKEYQQGTFIKYNG